MRQIAALRGGLLWAAGRALSGAYRPLSGEQRGAKLSPKHHSTSGEAKSPELAGRTLYPPPPPPNTYWSISTENGGGGMGSGFVSSRTQSLSWRGRGGEMDSCWVQRDKEWTELHQQSPESEESSGLACCTAQDFESSQGYRFSSDA